MDSDPEFVLYDWDKSHNTSFYKKTHGVFTSTKQDLKSMSRPNREPPRSSNRNLTNPTFVTEVEMNNNSGGEETLNFETATTLSQEVAEMIATEDIEGQEADKTGEKGKGKGGKRSKRRKRYKLNKKAGNLSRYSEREMMRETERNAKKLSSKIQIESLKTVLGNPWHNISFQDKKGFALHFYYSHLQEVGHNQGGKQLAREHARSLVGLSPRTIAEFSRDFETSTYIKESRRGKHSKTPTPINDPTFREEFKSHVKQNSRKSGEANLTAGALVEWVNCRLQLGPENSYSERTVVNWLHALGFKVVESKKGIYYDGHERPDVVVDRARYIKEYKEYYTEAVKVDPTTHEIIDRDKRYILVSQDEKINHSNDCQNRHWDNGDLNFPPNKSQGRTVMTSDILDPICGFMKYEDSVWEVLKDTEEIKQEINEGGKGKKGEFRARRSGRILDITSDGYYHTDLCLADFKKATKMCLTNYGNKYIPVFVTDWSPIHGSYGEDALNAKRMNVGVGGKQPLMKDGYFENSEGEKVTQPMVFQEGPDKGKAKGLRQVCTERFGPEAVKGKLQDGLVKMLEGEPDFKNQKPLLVEVVEAAGGKVLFGTKFHPELMTIENAYRDISSFMKKNNIVGSSKGYVERICDSYHSVDIINIRKYFLSVLKFMAFYLSGETGSTVFTLMAKQRKKHRAGAVFGPVDHTKKNYDRKRKYSL